MRGGILRLAFLLSSQVGEICQNDYFILEKHFEVSKTLCTISQENSPHFTDEKAKATEVSSLFKALLPQ